MTPVVPGLFEIANNDPSLIGSRCRGCGGLHFPAAVACGNPSCRDKAVDRVALPTQGTLYSFTIQHYQPPPLFRMQDWGPYAIGLIDLGEGLRVMGILRDVAFEDLAIGMPFRLVMGPLHDDEGGDPVVTYMFAPIAGSAR